MTPAAFASFTPRELQWRIDGYCRRDDRAFFFVAQLAAWVLSSLGARETAESLIGARGQTSLPPVPPHWRLDQDDD